MVLAAVGVAMGALVVDVVLGAGPVGSAVAVVALGLSVLAWLPLGRLWAARGVVAWALVVDAGAAYLAYVAVWTFTAGLSVPGLVGSVTLWLLEAVVLLVGLRYMWEFIDGRARRAGPASVDTPTLPHRSYRPFVSLHVPTQDEPPQSVIAILERLLEQEYDGYEIVLVDYTADPALWRPVEAFCARYDGMTFLHLEDAHAEKSKALSLALENTDPQAELIGIVEADCLVSPDFLRHCAPMFADDSIAFVQPPPDYRGWKEVAYFRRLYHAYGELFDTSPSSDDAAMLGGSLQLIRRSALEAAGGWDESWVAEDIHLSLRLLRGGGRGVHTDLSYGQAALPPTFEALKQRRLRWSFGRAKILRRRWRSLLPRRRADQDGPTSPQRWAFLMSGARWFAGLASVLFTGLLVLGALELIVGSGIVVRRLSGLLVLWMTIVGLAALRAATLVRRTSGANWGEAAGAFGLWLALGWSSAQGAARGIVSRTGVVPRTPTVRGGPQWYALRGNLTETALGVVCAVVGTIAILRWSPEATLVGGLLFIQAVGFLLAPVNSLAAIRADLSEELDERRQVVLASEGGPAGRGRLVIATAAAVTLVGVAIFTIPLALPERATTSQGQAPPGRGPDKSTPTTKLSETPQPTDRPRAPDSSATSAGPTRDLTTEASMEPRHTTSPTSKPTATQSPTSEPTEDPTDEPTHHPTGPPTDHHTGPPTSPPGKPTDK